MEFERSLSKADIFDRMDVQLLANLNGIGMVLIHNQQKPQKSHCDESKIN